MRTLIRVATSFSENSFVHVLVACWPTAAAEESSAGHYVIVESPPFCLCSIACTFRIHSCKSLLHAIAMQQSRSQTVKDGLPVHDNHSL